MQSSSGKLGRTVKQARDYVASVSFDRRYAAKTRRGALRRRDAGETRYNS
jgi:hypothetical protein